MTSELSDPNTNNCKFLAINRLLTRDAGSTFSTFLHITVHMQKCHPRLCTLEHAIFAQMTKCRRMHYDLLHYSMHS